MRTSGVAYDIRHIYSGQPSLMAHHREVRSLVSMSLPSSYQQFIGLSRYARFEDNRGRREMWEETVQRYFDFMQTFVRDKTGIDVSDTAQHLFHYVHDLKSMPSMRCLMTAGPALERDHLAGYNCAYRPINEIKAFDEIMYTLMCGTGVAWSVERQYTNRLPKVPDNLEYTDHTVIVQDSKLGWAKALREFLNLLYDGYIPNYDTSRVRGKGARLKTMGGRASGPEPFEDALKFIVRTFKGAQGRKLSSLECHDIACVLSDAVVVGGVRRAAALSLSNLSDMRMRDAKTGAWWETHLHRRLANNSVAFTETPEVGQFMEEFKALFDSKSGERGLFNREAARSQAMKSGRRRGFWDEPQRNVGVDENSSEEPQSEVYEAPIEFGTNPCSLHEDTILMTTDGPRRIKDLKDRQFVAYVNGIPYRARKGSWVSGRRELFRLSTKEGFKLDLTNDHRLMTPDGWKMSGEIELGEKVALCEQDDLEWPGFGDSNEGYLLGVFVGDGNYSKNPSANGNYFGQLKIWNEESGSEGMKEEASEAALQVFTNRRSDWKMWCRYDRNRYDMMNIGDLPMRLGLASNKRHDISVLETSSSDFHKAFLRGIFDADGHVEGSRGSSNSSGISIRLGQSSHELLVVCQRMLARLGIMSRISKVRDEGESLLPDGHGGRRLFKTKASWRLIITGASTRRFVNRIGFSNTAKRNKTKEIPSHGFNREKFTATVESFESLGVFDVWDAEVDSITSFDANGFHAHNSEIILRPEELCNLSSAVARSDDTEESLERKVRAAAVLGTWQSLLTDFRHVNAKWRRNCEEERLLGASLTGIMDCPLLNDRHDPELPNRLERLKQAAVDENQKWAKALGVNPSAAVTCVKPEGTASELVNSSSGIHPAYAKRYIRRVRMDRTDPLCQFMIDNGFPHEPEIGKEDRVMVFSFPKRASDETVMRDHMSAIDQLEHWKIFQDHYCEHKPSITVQVRDHEWPSVMAWAWENFDKMSGVAFLPYDGGSYRQAPYEEVGEQELQKLEDQMPQDVDWTQLVWYESTDHTTGTREMACSAGGCDVT